MSLRITQNLYISASYMWKNLNEKNFCIYNAGSLESSNLLKSVRYAWNGFFFCQKNLQKFNTPGQLLFENIDEINNCFSFRLANVMVFYWTENLNYSLSMVFVNWFIGYLFCSILQFWNLIVACLLNLEF